MATTKTIGATGRQHSTISGWITYLDAATFAGAETGECYNDGEFLEWANFVSGITNGTDRVILTASTASGGQGFADHASKATNALRYNVSNGVGMRDTVGGAGSTIIVDIAHLTITRMQFKRTCNYANLLEMKAASSDGIMTGCIFHHDTAGGSGGAVILNASVATNCLIIANGAASNVGLRMLGACTVTNNTVARTKGGTMTGLEEAYGTSTLVNNAVFGFSALTTGSTFAGNNNASDLAIGFGSANQASLTYASQFQNVTTTTEDFRAVGTGSLDNAGTASGAPSTDIIGQTRAGTPWIGAHEVAAAAASGFTAALMIM